MTAIRVRRGVLLLVLLAHIGLAGWLVQLTRLAPAARTSAQATAPAMTWLRLIDLPRRDASGERSPRAIPAPAQRSTSPQQRAASPTPALVQPEAITRPTPAAARDIASDGSPPATASTVAEHPAAPPLDLRLPRRPAGSQPPAAMTHDDLPSRLSREERLARDLGADGRLVEQVMANGHRFFKRGQCVEVRSARAVQLDPFNANARPIPKLVKQC